MKTDKRLEAFHSFNDHAWLKRLYKKLGPNELSMCTTFIAVHEGVSADVFEMAVNRMFIDKPKTRNWRVIMELLSCANTRASV